VNPWLSEQVGFDLWRINGPQVHPQRQSAPGANLLYREAPVATDLNVLHGKVGVLRSVMGNDRPRNISPPAKASNHKNSANIPALRKLREIETRFSPVLPHAAVLFLAEALEEERVAHI
jgi:hypothetical protein